MTIWLQIQTNINNEILARNEERTFFFKLLRNADEGKTLPGSMLQTNAKIANKSREFKCVFTPRECKVPLIKERKNSIQL